MRALARVVGVVAASALFMALVALLLPLMAITAPLAWAASVLGRYIYDPSKAEAEHGGQGR